MIYHWNKASTWFFTKQKLNCTILQRLATILNVWHHAQRLATTQWESSLQLWWCWAPIGFKASAQPLSPPNHTSMAKEDDILGGEVVWEVLAASRKKIKMGTYYLVPNKGREFLLTCRLGTVATQHKYIIGQTGKLVK